MCGSKTILVIEMKYQESQMTVDERNTLIVLYKEGPEKLRICLSTIPVEGFEYKPGPERWSIHEIVVHIIDSDLNSLMRFNGTIAEAGRELPVYNQELWVAKLFTPQKTVPLCLNLLEAFREYNGILLDSVKEGDWKNSVVHPERGVITLEKVLQMYTNHIHDHIKQIEKTHDTWQKQQRGEYVDPDRSLIYI
jgi:hypothetical protein